MKQLFSSDKFSYIHPSVSPRKSNEYSKAQMAEIEKNMRGITYNAELFKKAIEDSKGKIPRSQVGSMLVFPESKSGKMTDFIRNVFNSANGRLMSEYNDESDNTSHFDIDDSGKYFNAEFENVTKRRKDVFSSKSVVIYVAGCKSMTAQYLFEETIDECYSESEKHDKRVVKSDGKESDKLNFTDFRTFLVYDFNTTQFHQIGLKESEIYFAQRRRNYGTPTYDVKEVQMNCIDFSEEM